MRKIAFGYSTRCNLKCSHCVAASEDRINEKMELDIAKEVVRDLAAAGVKGISFTAGEPFLYFNDMLELIGLCRSLDIYTRIVTNSFWAKDRSEGEESLRLLKEKGLNQLRLSYSRWHQQHVDKETVLNAARGSVATGIDYFISFVTDFSEEDDARENYLRENDLKFFPEPVIYSGRAGSIGREPVFTDYQDNRCSMNPYLAPDLTMYGCCDAGSHFNTTNFFLIGNLREHTVEELFSKSENSPLFNCIRNQGLSTIASYAGMKAREIITYRKCDLCKKNLRYRGYPQVSGKGGWGKVTALDKVSLSFGR